MSFSSISGSRSRKAVAFGIGETVRNNGGAEGGGGMSASRCALAPPAPIQSSRNNKKQPNHCFISRPLPATDSAWKASLKKSKRLNRMSWIKKTTKAVHLPTFIHFKAKVISFFA